MTAEDLHAVLNDARALESLYRQDPDAFTRAFPEAYANAPEAPLLQAWQERLFFSADAQVAPAAASSSHAGAITLVIGLSLLAGTLVKLPVFLPSVSEEFFYPRNVPAIVILALAAYFLATGRASARTCWRVLLPAAAGMLFLNVLPDRSKSDTLIMAVLHMPLFFWSLLGLAVLGEQWRSPARRMDYIRYNGEMVIHTTIVLLGGMVLTGITMALFTLIKVNIEEWYFVNVVVYGAVAAPLVGTLIIDRLIGRRVKLAPLLARIFSPLFLLTVAAYLVAIVVQRKSPYTDREFLITFNGLLLVVLALSVLVIAERPARERVGFADVVNIGLVLVTLIIDVIALSAIVFRLSSYGFTPNRVAVLGANVIAFVHLAGILLVYLRLLLRRADSTELESWIARYLPVYTAWSVFVAVGMPLLYRFR